MLMRWRVVLMSLPEPLMPADCDLRDFQFMPLDIARLFGSEFHARASDGEWRAGVTLWLKSYHQVPAASLPDDDVALARLAEYGRDLSSWHGVKEGALHGWIKCSDGRLYHPVVAEKALEGWLQKLQGRLRGGKGNAKRWKLAFDPKELEAQVLEASRLLRALNPSSLATRPDIKQVPGGECPDYPASIASGSAENPASILEGSHLQSSEDRKGQGQVKGEDKDQEHVQTGQAGQDARTPEQVSSKVQGKAKPATPKPDLLEGFDQFYRLYPRRQKRPDAEKAWRKLSPEQRQAAMAALPAHCQRPDWLKDGGQFVPLPASWLNGQRWEDELPTQNTHHPPSRFTSLDQIDHEAGLELQPDGTYRIARQRA